MTDLRKELVKLAHDVPSMRKHLVPILASEGKTADVHFRKGDKLVVKPVPPGSRKSLPASKITEEMTVTVQDDGASGGLDVYDVIRPDGKEDSIYGTQVIRKAPKGKTASSIQVTYSTSANDVMFPFLEELAFSLALKKGMLGAKPVQQVLPEGPMVTLNVTDFSLSLIWNYANKVLEILFIDFSVDTNGSVGTQGKEFKTKFPLATVCKLPMQTLASALALKLPR